MDVDGDGRLSKDDMHQMVRAAIAENGITLTTAQVDQIIDKTFLEVGKQQDGFVSLEDYTSLVNSNQSMLIHLTLNLACVLSLTNVQAAMVETCD